MFAIDQKYSKAQIYEILQVPLERRHGAWDTGYRQYEENIFLFSNVGIPGRTGHDYNNYWDGDLFVWEGKNKSNANQPLVRKMLNPEPNQNNFLFTRTNDKEPFVYEGTVIVKEFENTSPIRITWQLNNDNYYPFDNFHISLPNEKNLFYEGEMKKIIINKYERNPLARRFCIEHFGVFCQVCDLDFYKTYGELGKQFIHVHHIIPLSKINKEYIINPITDMIPICPNCHYMIHRKKEVLSVKELKDIYQKNNRID
jgi:5-methylcytosine-specific restriction protein A